MVKKHLISFNPGDVLRVVLQCKNQDCRAELSFAEPPTVGFPIRCPACHAEWNSSDRYGNHTNQVGLLLCALRYFSAIPGKETDMPPWTVRLVIESGPGSTGEDVQ